MSIRHCPRSIALGCGALIVLGACSGASDEGAGSSTLGAETTTVASEVADGSSGEGEQTAEATENTAVFVESSADAVGSTVPLFEINGPPPVSGDPVPAPEEPQFVATFDTADDFFGRFQTEVLHGAADQEIRSWSGDHDMDCGAPATQRTVHVENAPEMFWWCPPRPDAPASSGHVMTSMNTTGYAQVNFAPNEPLTDVRKVCWDQNMTDLGGRKWTQVVIVPEETFQANGGRLDYVKPGLETDVAVQGTHLTEGVFMFEMLKGSTAVYFGRNVYEPNFAGFQAGAEKSRRFEHCITDLQNGTVQIDLERDTETETRISGGAFPSGPARVIFQDDNYNPPKSPPETADVPDPFTWHWDNIVIF